MTATRTGERIYFDGDDAKFLYLIAMGKSKLIRNATLGREALLDTLRGGEYFGALTALCRQEGFPFRLRSSHVSIRCNRVPLCPKTLKAFCISAENYRLIAKNQPVDSISILLAQAGSRMGR